MTGGGPPEPSDYLDGVRRALDADREQRETRLMAADFYARDVQIGDEVYIKAKVIMGPPTWVRHHGLSVMCRIMSDGGDPEIIVPVSAIVVLDDRKDN